MQNLSFAKSKRLSPSNSAAYADVIVEYTRAGRRLTSNTQCLVDTGSPYTILPLTAATLVGLTPTGPLVSFFTVGGARHTFASHPSVRIIVEGYALTTRVLFAPVPSPPAPPTFVPILGRIDLLSAFDSAFDTTHWHFG